MLLAVSMVAAGGNLYDENTHTFVYTLFHIYKTQTPVFI